MKDGRLSQASATAMAALLLTSQWPDRVCFGIIYAAFGPEEFDALRADLESKHVAVKEGWWGKQMLIVEDCDGYQMFFAHPKRLGE